MESRGRAENAAQDRRKDDWHRFSSTTIKWVIASNAMARTQTIILAGGHVRASAGALAVHTALIPRVCVCVCLSGIKLLFITPRIGTKFVSVDR